MMMTDPNDEMLEDLFAQARAAKPPVSDDLMARVLADAERAGHGASVVVDRPGLWSRFLDLVGGWPAVSGLAAATVAGVWIGVAPPAMLDDYTAGLTGDVVSVSLFSDMGFLTGEEVADG